MRCIHGTGLALAFLVGCGFDVRSAQYTCEAESDCEAGRTCEMGWCVIANDTNFVDAAPGAPDAAPGAPDATPTITYVASVADCIDTGAPDPDFCETAIGAGQFAIDLLDADTGRPFEAYLRFDTGDQFAGKTVTAVTLRLTATDDPKASGPASGSIWQVAAFVRADLFAASPATIGTTALAVDQGSVSKNEVVDWVMPVDSVSPNSGVFFAVLSLSNDSVHYWNLNGASPPQLIVDYQ